MRLYATEMLPSTLQIAVASRAFTKDFLTVILYENHEYYFFFSMQWSKALGKEVSIISSHFSP